MERMPQLFWKLDWYFILATVLVPRFLNYYTEIFHPVS